jgi:hypothetical protein
MPMTDPAGSRAVTIRNLFGDTLIYGVAGLATSCLRCGAYERYGLGWSLRARQNRQTELCEIT